MTSGRFHRDLNYKQLSTGSAALQRQRQQQQKLASIHFHGPAAKAFQRHLTVFPGEQNIYAHISL